MTIEPLRMASRDDTANLLLLQLLTDNLRCAALQLRALVSNHVDQLIVH